MGLSFKNWTYRWKVRFSDLIAAFDFVRDRFRAWLTDHVQYGIVLGSTSSVNRFQVTQNPGTPDLQVLIQPGVAYTSQGARIVKTSAAELVNCAVDKNLASTIPAPGNEIYISIFAVPKFVDSDYYAADGYGNPFYFTKTAGYVFEVEKGTEDVIGGASTIPTRVDAVRLAVVRLENGTTQITNTADPYNPPSTAGLIRYDLRQEWNFNSALWARNISAREYMDLKGQLGESTLVTNGRFYNEAICRSWVRVVGGSGAVARKYNVVSVTRLSAGKYEIKVPTGLFGAISSIVAMVTIEDNSGSLIPNEGRAWATDAETIRVDIVGDDTGWANVDRDFSLIIFGRPITTFYSAP